MKTTYFSLLILKKLQTFATILFLLFFLNFNALAQLSGWGYKDAIRIQENSNSLKLNYQVLLTVNTQALISAGKMLSTGNDIRFAKDCNGAVLYNYFIESGINTTTTQIWVLVDTLAANGNRIINMFYGNATAPVASSFDNTFPTASRLVITTGAVTLTGPNNYSWFEIGPAATVNVGATSILAINARKIKITGTLNGAGAGMIGTPPGGVEWTDTGYGRQGVGGAGGAHGGDGGNGGKHYASPPAEGGIATGSSTTNVNTLGYAGGSSLSSNAGNGGGGVTLSADAIEITGLINMNGANGTWSNPVYGASGAGAGGGILLNGGSVKVTSSALLNAKGGNGGDASTHVAGGGGGGGRIKIFYDQSIVNNGTLSVAGGVAGVGDPDVSWQEIPPQPGQLGTTHTGGYISGIPTFTILPHVALTASNTSICPGSNVTFTASSPGFSNYNFYVNAASVQNGVGNTYSTSTLTAGNNTIKVLATYSAGCIDTATMLVTVTASPPTPTITAGGPTTFCQGDSVILTSSLIAGNSWSNGATTQSITVTTSNSYTVANSNGCGSTSAATVVSVNPSPPTPVITAGGPTTFCQGGSVVLTSSLTSGNTWSDASTGQSITVTSSNSYTVTDNSSCGSTSTPIIVTVNPNPSTPVITPDGPTTFCQGGSVVLTSSSATDNSWNPGGASTASITVNTSGNYTVTVTDANLCTAASGTTTIVVSPVTSPTITPGGPTTFCQGDSVVLTSSLTAGNGWSNGATTQSITVTSSDNFTVTDNNGCGGTSATTTVTVNPLPAVTLSSFNDVCSDAPAFALNGGAPLGGTYSGTGVNAGNFEPATAGTGTYGITYTYTDVNNCSNSASENIFVNTCTGITENAVKLSTSIYPNPNKGKFSLNIELAEKENIIIKLYNVQGKLIFSEQLENIQGKLNKLIDVSHQGIGIYHLQIVTATETVNKKVVVN